MRIARTSTGNITASGVAASGIHVIDGDYVFNIDAGTVNGGALDLVLGTGTGISIADGNSGAITLAGGASVGALSGWAIQDGNGVMTLTSRGTITDNISGAGGADRLLLYNGSLISGIAYLGADDDIATIRGGAGIASVTTFDGEDGRDVLRFEGGARVVGAAIDNWETLNLTGTIAIDTTSRLALTGNRRIGAFDAESLAQLDNAGLLASPAAQA